MPPIEAECMVFMVLILVMLLAMVVCDESIGIEDGVVVLVMGSS